MTDGKATLKIDDKSAVELDVLSATLGDALIDIRNISNKGYFSFDPGFTSTASCESKITFIDGNAGILLHRGFPIEQLVKNANYLEVCYILFYGEAPTKMQFIQFKEKVTKHTMLPEFMANVLSAFSRDAHPMAMLCSMMCTLAAVYHDSIDVNNAQDREMTALRLIAKMPTMAALCYKYTRGQAFIYPCNELSYTGNFLHMMFATPCETYTVHPILEKALDQILVLHADHEQNASTSTVRTVGSSGANPFACIAAGIASLWGHAHGGANEACLRMLEEIKTPDQIPKYIARAKDKNDPFRLMGFGHRVYKNYDPRATIMRETCYEVLKALDVKDDLFSVAMELEHIALHDAYFTEKKLYPNVDFYSGIILKAIGIPLSMFTVIFAMARTIGWISHWHEMHQDGLKIARPRQRYTGYTKRDFVSYKE